MTGIADGDSIFEAAESQVRSYCRRFPAVLSRARGHLVHDEQGRAYIDFFMGAGALNYGHNDPRIKRAVIDYLDGDNIVHSLDFHTVAKRAFMQRFHDVVLAPRGLDYRMQFTGPTGANVVEAALKLARKVTGREPVVAFTNAFHGMSLGALAATGSRYHRQAAGQPLSGVIRMPYDGYMDDGFDTLAYLERMLDDPSSGMDLPAAILVETVQAEGGLNVASKAWLQGLSALAARQGALLIVDDIQSGCGRTGPFFSFERADIVPDIVCLSKSLSGLGLPMSMALIRPDHDENWRPGEHNGTFRGNNLAFVAGAVALDYWQSPAFIQSLDQRAAQMHRRLDTLVRDHGALGMERRGLGLMQGLKFQDPSLAETVSTAAFAEGLIAETCGPRDEVLKFMPPLTVGEADLDEGFDRLETVVHRLAATATA